jgi:hypothetical protein
MVNKYQIRNRIINHPEEGFYIDDNENTTDKEGRFLCTLSVLAQKTREKLHCDFECIYSDEISLLCILRCKECGTVIFSYDNEWYDDALCCPTCGNYKTGFKYYTKEEIENDESKRKEIDTYIKMTEQAIEFNKRYKRRGGKYDWQLGKKRIYFKNKGLALDLECENVCKSYFKGLRLIVHPLTKDGMGWICGKRIYIPLSISAFKSRINMRKYLKEHKND